MCHGYDAREWTRTVEEDEAAEESEEPDGSEEPSFFDDEPAQEVELLTDGGDDD